MLGNSQFYTTQYVKPIVPFHSHTVSSHFSYQSLVHQSKILGWHPLNVLTPFPCENFSPKVAFLPIYCRNVARIRVRKWRQLVDAVKAVCWEACFHCSLNEVMFSAKSPFLSILFHGSDAEDIISKVPTFVLFFSFTSTSFTANRLKTTIFLLMPSGTYHPFSCNFKS